MNTLHRPIKQVTIDTIISFTKVLKQDPDLFIVFFSIFYKKI